MQKYCFLLIFLPVLSLAKGNVKLDKAIELGWISLDAFSTGDTRGKCLKARITNLRKTPVVILVEPGAVFQSGDSADQDVIVVREKVIKLEKYQKRIVTLFAYCIQSKKSIPDEKAVYHYKGFQNENLKTLADFINSNKFHTLGGAVQHALWAISDDHNLAGIYSPDNMEATGKIIEETARLTGKPIPPYFIVYKERRDRVFSGEPVSLHGIFKYKLNEASDVSIDVIDKEGNPIQIILNNQLQRAGHSESSFYVEYRKIPKGEYTSRLLVNGLVLDTIVFKI